MKYTFITANFNNFDLSRNINKNNTFKHIVITDNNNLDVKTGWEKIINPSKIDPNWSARKKTYYVRYHPFDFCDSDYAIWMDSSIELLVDINYFNNYMKPNCDIFYLSYCNSVYDYLYNPEEWPLKSLMQFPDNKYLNDNYKTLCDYINNKNINSYILKYMPVCFGVLRIYKNNNIVKKVLNEIYDTLIINKNVYDINFYDEPTASLIFNNYISNLKLSDAKLKLLSLDSLDGIIYKYKHNTNIIIQKLGV